MSEKSSGKTSKRGKPFAKGDPRIQRGKGPAKGSPNAGRPPDWWKEKMVELRDRFLIAAEAEGVLDNPDHPQWAKVGTWVHEQLQGRAKQQVDVTSNGHTLDSLLAQSYTKPEP